MQEVNGPESTPGETREDHILALLEMIAITQLRQLDLLMVLATAADKELASSVIELHRGGRLAGEMPYMDQSGE